MGYGDCLNYETDAIPLTVRLNGVIPRESGSPSDGIGWWCTEPLDCCWGGTSEALDRSIDLVGDDWAEVCYVRYYLAE